MGSLQGESVLRFRLYKQRGKAASRGGGSEAPRRGRGVSTCEGAVDKGHLCVFVLAQCFGRLPSMGVAAVITGTRRGYKLYCGSFWESLRSYDKPR